MTARIDALVEKAAIWRAGEEGTSLAKATQNKTIGVVLFFDGEIYGWRDRLRDPHQDMPGAIAVDADGQAWEARGGDDYHGAKAWVRLGEAEG